MKFKVRISAEALRDLNAIYNWIADDSPLNADRWLDEIEHAVGGLSEFPYRHPMAPEANAFRVDIRHLIVGAYRVIYKVAGSRVTVLHVRHAARRPVRRRHR